MSTRNAAFAVVITVAHHTGDGAMKRVSVTGPNGQWDAMLSLGDRKTFLDEIGHEVHHALTAILDRHPDEWPVGLG